MPNNNNSSNTPKLSGGNDPSLTELDFDSFLSSSPREPELDEGFKNDIEATEKSLEADIRGLYEDIMSHTPSPDEPVLTQSEVPEPPQSRQESTIDGMWMNPEDYYDRPQEPSPFAPVLEGGPQEASPAEPEVYYNPEPPAEPEAAAKAAPEPEEDFGAVIAGALGELDSLLDGIYGGAPKVTEKPAMQDVSSVSGADSPDEQGDAFNVVSPEALDSLTPDLAAKKSAAEPLAQSDNYFLGRVPATAPDEPEASPFIAPAQPATQAKRPSARPAEESKQKKASAVFPAKGDSAGEIIRKLVLIVSIVTIVVSSGILVNSYFIEPYRFNVQADKAADDLLSVDSSGNINQEDMSAVSAKNPEVVYPEGLLQKYYKLYAANDDLAGWINIPALQINLPLVQGSNNEYYLKRDVYGKRTKYGVPFFDYRNSLRALNRNTVIYGHNMEYDDLIFGMLENYRTIGGFKSAPVIECNTIYNDYSWLVYAVFVTNGEKKDDNGYVFNYNFTELDNFTFLEYIEQVDQRKLYTTGVDMLSTDKILTLSTCCYDFDGARLVVIARLLRDGESLHVSTANALANPNPRYPQAWYDAQNKSNPYASAEKWVAYADLTNLSN